MFRKNLLALMLLVTFFIVSSQARRKKYTKLLNESGTFRADSGNHRWVIRTQPEKRISLRFTEFTKGRISIRGGRSTLYHIYEINEYGEMISKTMDLQDSGDVIESDEEIVTTPFQIDSTTKKLFVTYTSDAEVTTGFVAKYETYPADLCRIDDLETRGADCPTYEFAPVSSNCTYNVHCNENVTEIGMAKCRSQVWQYSITCIPDQALVEQCVITEGNIANCPYSLEDLAKYYKYNGGSEPSPGTQGSRGGRGNTVWKARCTTDVCNHPNCHTKRMLGDIFSCMVCQFYKCRKSYVAWP